MHVTLSYFEKLTDNLGEEETFLKYIRLLLDEKADDVASAASDGLF